MQLTNYQISDKIYTGSRTLVYRGQRGGEQQPVVIKFLRSEYPSFSGLVQFRNKSAIEIVKDYGNLPLVKCFFGQLNQVFMNILANAIDALDAACVGRTFAELQANPQRIMVCTEMSIDLSTVAISIKYNGQGMSDSVQSRIFDHLFTTKEVGKGTGLGLAIARQIVEEKHGGAIAVNSTLDHGTEFSIMLPMK